MSSRAASRSRADRDLAGLPAWLAVTRAAALLPTVGAALVGALLVARLDGASWRLAGLALALVAVTHLCGNLLAALSGRPAGAPDDPRSRAARLIASRAVRRRSVGITVLVLAAVAVVLLVVLTVARGRLVLVVAGVAALLALARALRPRTPGVDELEALVLRGPLLVAGAGVATAGSLPWQLWLAGVPWGLLCLSARLGEQLDELDDGSRDGPAPRTSAARLGGTGARGLTVLVLVAVYAVTGAAVAVGALPWPVLVVALALPLLRSVAGTLRRRRPPSRPSQGQPPAGHAPPLAGPAPRPVLAQALTRHLRAFAGLLVLGAALAALLGVGVLGAGG